jgi:hypothetical protein
MQRSTSTIITGAASAIFSVAVYLFFTFLTPYEFAADLVFGFLPGIVRFLFNPKLGSNLQPSGTFMRSLAYVSVFVPYLLSGCVIGYLWPMQNASIRPMIVKLILRIGLSFLIVAGFSFAIVMYALAHDS